MGQLFQSAGLTVPNSALMNSAGQPTFVGSPNQVLSRANSALPSTTDILGTDPLHPTNKTPNLPTIGTPSFPQAAATGPAGTPSALSPGLTKAGKLTTLLLSGLQGALAGRAADEQATVASGGRRSGGAGMAFQAGYQLPFVRAAMPLQLEQQQAETALARAGLQPVDTPYGQMPAAFAQHVFPSLIRAQSARDVQQMKGDTAETVQGMKGQTALDVARTNKRFMAAPGVGLYDTQTGQLLPGTQKGVMITSEIAQDYGLPQEFIGKPMDVANLAQLERVQVMAAPTTRTQTDPLGLTTVTNTQKNLPAGSTIPQAGGRRGGPGGGNVIFPNTPRAGAPARNAGGGGSGNAGGGNSSVIDSTAQRLVEGDMDPSQLRKDAKAYPIILDRASQYSQQKYGKPFDIAQATIDYDYAKNTQTQNTLKYLNSLTGNPQTKTQGNLDKLIAMSDSIPRTPFPPVNDVEAWAKLKGGSGPMAAYAATITEVSDQVAKILQGGGSGSGTSDAKLRQAAELFQKGFNKEQIRDVATTLRDLLGNRKRELIGDNRYLQKQYGGSGGAQVIRWRIQDGRLVQ